MLDTDVTACAELLERGDPDRFLATMAVPAPLRPALFALYAFNVEVSRAPWVTQESMIAEMRLQWWRDALEEIGGKGPVRRHNVVTPLSRLLDAEDCATLDRAVAARRWDIYKDPFEDAAHFANYIDDTSAGLLWTAARLTGVPPEDEAAVRAWGRAMGLANWLRAIPALEAAQRVPLVDGRPEAIAALAHDARKALPKPPKAARPALLVAWQAAHILRQAEQDPHRVGAGSLGRSEFGRRFSLARAALFGL